MNYAAGFRVLRLPSNVLNGVTVALGVALVHLSLRPFVPSDVLTALTNGALYASLSHLVHRRATAMRRALAGGTVGVAVAFLVGVTIQFPLLLHAAIGCVAFGAMMALAWGQRAGPMSFTAVLALVLSLANRSQLPAWQFAPWSLLGAALYGLWAWGSNAVLAAHYRTLAVATTLNASAQLLRVRAEVLEQLDASASDTDVRFRQIDREARLAAVIQAARELVFVGSEPVGRVPHTQLLLRSIEVRDLVLTSRLDLELLGDNKFAREIRRRLARVVRSHALALEQAATALQLGNAEGLETSRDQAHIHALLDERHLSASDPRIRLLPAIASRQQQLLDQIALLHDLIRGRHPQSPLSLSDRRGLQSAESWPLREPLDQLNAKSPVFRHAVRSAIALVSAHAFASALPWATHPYWIVLSVAVVLRGNFSHTLARRNQRVIGTALGCLIAAGTVSIVPEYALALLFFAAVGVAHAYVNVRYTLTATAATLMALLQTRLLTDVTLLILLERLVDTVMGATLAWAFSFVLPSWASSTVPALVARTLSTLRSYAHGVLILDEGATEGQQVAREQTYEVLETLSSTLQLSAEEPRHVRPRIGELLSFVDHAQRLMAHLSSLRLLLLRRKEQLQGTETEAALEEARSRLSAPLELDAPAHLNPEALGSVETPSVSPEHAAFPWLRRRINLTIHEASLTGEAARAALAAGERPLGTDKNSSGHA